MSTNRVTGGTLIIAGTCIGAGMLALPISMAGAGFLSAAIILIIFWLAMVLTGLYVIEVNLELPAESNFISMAKATLGRPGEVVAWLTYVLLLYSLMAAYMSAGGDVVDHLIRSVWQIDFARWVSSLPWLIIGAIVIYCGTRYVDGVNRLLIMGLVITYCMLVVISLPKIHVANLVGGHPTTLYWALPILSTAFGYHVVIPSMRTYLAGDPKSLIRIVIIGTGITLLVYLVWNFVVFGTIPTTGELSLASIKASGQPATEIANTLASLTQSSKLLVAANYFAFFAIATSFIGISLALFDFVSDGFHIPRSKRGKALTAALTFVPPFIFAIVFPNGFITALSYAGVFVAVLHGILPAAMAWAGRRRNMPERYIAPGGTIGMVVIILFSLLIIVSQLS
ncbi:MAG: aromatic amino acid transporter [Pseudomonadota bacterium]|nr:aromatic amino acid transporter [Pseudomonadota bacterium]